VHEERNSTKGCDRRDLVNDGMGEIEPLAPRMQLDPAMTGIERPHNLGDRSIRIRIHSQEGDQPTLSVGGFSEHPIVVVWVTRGVCCGREHRTGMAGCIECGYESIGGVGESVRIRVASVGMGVPHLH
jgi:hypothetical protein